MNIRIWVVALFALLLGTLGFSQQPSSVSGVVSDIEITGNQHVSKEAILARMRTHVGGPYLQAQVDQDRQAIMALGFFRAVNIVPTPLEGSNWRISVEVSEYPVVKEIRIVGNTVIPTDRIMKVVQVKIGQPFNVSAADPTATAIAKLYTDKGYFAQVMDLGPMEDSPGTVNIQIAETRVSSVGVEGNTRTKNYVMRRLIKTKAGEAYNTHKWDDDLRRLASTQWFDPVNDSEKPTPDGTGMDLLAIVKEARTGQAMVGVSLDPTSGFAGEASLRDTNFNGTGQSIGVSFMQAITGGGPSASVDYANPFIDTHDTALSASVYSRIIYRFTGNGFGTQAAPTDNLYFERRTGGALNFARPIANHVTGSIGGRLEGVKTSNVKTNNQNGFIEQDGTIGVLSLATNINRRDYDLDPSRGDWFNIALEPGVSKISHIGGAIQDQSILGTHTFGRGTVEYRAYWTPQPPRGRQFDAPRRVFAFRVRYGKIIGKEPFFEQFFVGGADTVRGYDDDRYWGTDQLIANFEYRHPIQKSFNVIGFIDYGGAWGGYGTVNNYTQYRNFKMHVGYGVGVGFRTPLGQIRLDFGINEKGGSRTHFLIGTAF